MPKFALLIMVGLLYTSTSFSQTCCSGGIPLSNSIGLPYINEGSYLIGLSYDYNYLNTLNNGSDELDDDSRKRVTQSLLLNFGYSFSSYLSIEALFTYVNQKREINQFGNVNIDETYGIGDGVVLLKYNKTNFFNQINNLGVGLGAKVPLGATDKKSDRGILLNPDLQPGSGAWDLIFWSLYKQSFSFRPSADFSLSFIYRYTGTNKNYLDATTYRFGQEFQWFLNYSDQFLLHKTLINPGLSIKYRQASQDEIGGISLSNTGGKWVSLVPKIDIELNSKFNLLSKVEIPIYSYVDGTQLTPTYRITIGLFYTFSKSKKQI